LPTFSTTSSRNVLAAERDAGVGHRPRIASTLAAYRHFPGPRQKRLICASVNNERAASLQQKAAEVFDRIDLRVATTRARADARTTPKRRRRLLPLPVGRAGEGRFVREMTLDPERPMSSMSCCRPS
jgi:hypothetical protein